MLLEGTVKPQAGVVEPRSKLTQLHLQSWRFLWT